MSKMFTLIYEWVYSLIDAWFASLPTLLYIFLIVRPWYKHKKNGTLTKKRIIISIILLCLSPVVFYIFLFTVIILFATFGLAASG